MKKFSVNFFEHFPGHKKKFFSSKIFLNFRRKSLDLKLNEFFKKIKKIFSKEFHWNFFLTLERSIDSRKNSVRKKFVYEKTNIQ